MRMKALICVAMTCAVLSVPAAPLPMASPFELSVANAVTLPILVTPEQEAEIGKQLWESVLADEQLSTNPKHRARVKAVVAKLTAKLSPKRTWTVEVFESDMVNAFAIPGGYIGVYTGMLATVRSDDELAVVLGHELSHVTERHFAKQHSKELLAILGMKWLRAKAGARIPAESLERISLLLGIGAEGVGLAFQRSYEIEADRVGLMLMAKATFDPRTAIDFWERMQDGTDSSTPELLSTHPTDEHRIEELKKALPAALKVYRS